jgi:hypothetical protein
VAETTLAVRGFHEKSPETRELLETVGGTFLAGYGAAAQARRPADAEPDLLALPPRFRGFGYEGAAMAFAVLDGLTVTGRGRRLVDFLAGQAKDHVYLAYIGAGWALARLPRLRWPSVSSSVDDPLLRWLLLDGYGFHQAYFHTDKYVHGRYRDDDFAWPGTDGDYPNHAIDQGIGRALWFVGGADVDMVTGLADRFPESRRPTLYSGIGLAATYAGGACEGELIALRERAGDYQAAIAQGSAFAAEARVRAGLVTPETAVATEVFCGVPPKVAADITNRNKPTRTTSGDVPAYEVWRLSVADEFAGRRLIG